MSYNVFTAEYHGVINHIFIFLETQDNGDGVVYHVIGSILQGMIYETKPRQKPETSFEFVTGSLIRVGLIKQDEVKRLEAVCESVPPPGRQVRLNGKPLDPTKPIRRCGEWVQEVLEILRQQHILLE